MSRQPYQLEEDTRPRLGLVVLQADETIEDDFRRLFASDAVRLHITRIPSGAELTPETIRAMETALPVAAALMPASVAFDAVGYACTSGTTLIGPDRVRDLVQSACNARSVTNPLTAAHAAIKALDLRRVGIVSPYIEPVSDALRSAFEESGVAVPKVLSFGEEVEANVARIAPTSIVSAARSIAKGGGVDGIFLSCTNLRTLGIIGGLETELGMPVLSSNLVLAWHLAMLSGRDLGLAGTVQSALARDLST